MAHDYTTPLFQDFWDRSQTLSTTPGFNGWTIKDTSAAGTPTYAVAGRACTLTLDSTSEAQVVTLYQNNVLPWNLGELKWVEVLAKVSGIDAVTTLAVGLGTSQNDTLDSVSYNAWFRMEGSASTSALVVETDDATVDNNDVATATTLAAVYKKLTIDFTAGLDDVRFFVNGTRVASGTTFDMSAGATSQGLQFIAQIQKASGTGTPSLTLGPIRCRRAYTYPSA